jgi:molybdopterin-guanine dinucleotide biosynthesis protein MobB
MAIPIITIIGTSGTGKTTLIEKLIAELKRRNYQIATIKHHSHAGFDIDYRGKDSWRFAQAGSDQVIIAAPDKIATYRILQHELSLDEIAADVKGVDLILAEGYRQAGKPTLEVLRSAHSTEMVSIAEYRFAVASDINLDVEVPQFDLEDVEGIADIIEKEFING